MFNTRCWIGVLALCVGIGLAGTQLTYAQRVGAAARADPRGGRALGGMHAAPRAGGIHFSPPAEGFRRFSAPGRMHAFDGGRHVLSPEGRMRFPEGRTRFMPPSGTAQREHHEGIIGRGRPGGEAREGRHEQGEESEHHRRFAYLPFWYGFGPYGYYGYYDYYPFYYGDEYPVYVPSEPYAGEETEETEEAGPTLQRYLDEAASAFLAGRYEEAARIVGHAAVDYPRAAKVHEILSLTLFAEGNYGGAALEAHAALALAPASDWPTLYRYYGDVATYTQQYRALEKYARENPSSAAAAFLLGYHDLMMGHRETAHRNFQKAVKLAPHDTFAQTMVHRSAGKPAAKG